MDATREQVARHISAEAGNDPRRASKIRCSLRAVLSTIDGERSGHVLGLGVRVDAFRDLTAPLAKLADLTIDRVPGRRAVRRSALGRLFVWALEVDAAPESLTAIDMAQFRAWLIDVGVRPGEILAVAHNFVELRWSEAGRTLFRPRPAAATRIQLEAPLAHRFGRS
jgi:hypothetical protein